MRNEKWPRFMGALVMMLPANRFSRDIIAALSEADREARLREMEQLMNPTLREAASLADFQERLYSIIEKIEALGHFLGPWEYDVETEYWGGKSYMDPTVPDELLLKSQYPHGIRLAWGDFNKLQNGVPEI